MLVSFLDSHPEIRCRGELLRHLDGRSAIDIIDTTFAKAPRGVTAKGFKVFYYHPMDDPDSHPLEYLASLDDLHVIHLTRRNILRTLVSRKIAELEGFYKHQPSRRPTDPEAKRVAFTVDELERRFAQTRGWEQSADRLFHDLPLLPVTYEELTTDPADQFRRITDFLGVPFAPPSTGLVRQNPELLRDLIVDYDTLASAFVGTDWESFFTG